MIRAVIQLAVLFFLKENKLVNLDGSAVIGEYYDDDSDNEYAYEDDAFTDEEIQVSKTTKYGSSLNCIVKYPGTRANNVNRLSPFDVEVVAALGDSLTAALAAGANTAFGIPWEYKGLSWSIGGKSSLSRITTLPNILKEFNQDLFGFSKNKKWLKSKEAFNRAVTGATVKHLLEQAKDLVKQMRKTRQMRKWKVITIFIGSNDLCHSCKHNEHITVRNFMRDLRRTLNYLSHNVRFAFINLALLLDVSILEPLKGIKCGLIHNFVCSCVKNRPKQVSRVAKAINRQIVHQFQYKQPYDRRDFAVVVQPLYSKTMLPLKTKHYWFKRKCRIGGSWKRKCPVPDKSYLAPDCFHFSKKTHAIMASYLWNNMFQPVGMKTTAIQWGKAKKLICPSHRFPYFRTNSNSKLTL